MKKSLVLWVSLVALLVAGLGCENGYYVTYTAEPKGDACIKFEDAMFYDEDLLEWVEACLGEDGVQDADEFWVGLDGYTEDIDVTVKSGKCNESVSLAWGTYSWDAYTFEVLMGEVCGFTIFAVPYDDGCDLIVLSDTDNETAALSNLTFCFGDGVTVVSPPEGPYEIWRYSEYSEPTEPEEEDED